MKPSPFRDALLEHRLLAVIRAPSADAALGAALAVVAGGLPILEVTFTVPDATRVMRTLKDRSDVMLGAGTVLTVAEARAAIESGARYLVAPNMNPDVGRVAREAGVAWVPGAFTTGEILAAMAAGADLVKVYPVGVIGVKYIEVIRDPLPEVPMLAAGGTNLENIVPFLRAGCVGCGIGGALADPRLAAAGDHAEITRRAREFVSRVREERPAVPAQA
jgi:2-dehydro-3-deoxyphosphogluconate aldolase/(4S)-4-hydroxy-2-oxoglutarate aldolase